MTTVLGGCAGLKRRSDADKPTVATVDTGKGATATGAPAPTGTGPVPTPVPIQNPPPLVEPPPVSDKFLQKEPPRVGVILGPGVLRAYAHIGVLKEMARARIPIKAVVGLEWGALIGGLYAAQGQANEVEWKAFKLKEDDVPTSGGLLSSGLKPQSIANLNEFFGTVFVNASAEKSKIDFACPTYSLKTEKMIWVNRGPMKSAMSNCMPYVPYYKDNGGWVAVPFGVEEAAQYLRSRGVNLVIFVNVLAQGEILPDKLADDQYAASVLWAEARRQFARKHYGVNVVINVNTGTSGLTDIDDRRAMVDAGSKAAHDVVNKLVTQYGF